MSDPTPIPAEAYPALAAWQADPTVQAALAASDWKTAFSTYRYLEAGDPPFTPLRKPLREATITAITSGGLYIAGEQPPFDAADVYGDASMRLIPTGTPNERIKLAHDHYDHTVPDQDLNTISPAQTLIGLQREGQIGAVAPYMVSTHGYIPVWTRALDGLIPAVLNFLHTHPTDAALLVPV